MFQISTCFKSTKKNIEQTLKLHKKLKKDWTNLSTRELVSVFGWVATLHFHSTFHSTHHANPKRQAIYEVVIYVWNTIYTGENTQHNSPSHFNCFEYGRITNTFKHSLRLPLFFAHIERVVVVIGRTYRANVSLRMASQTFFKNFSFLSHCLR